MTTLSESNDTQERVRHWLAGHQGLVARRQALSLGLTATQLAHRLETGEWIRVHRGIYRLAAAPDGPLVQLKAAVLAVGGGSVASHTSAAWLWQLRDAVPRSPVVTVPFDRRVRLEGVRVVRTRTPAFPVTVRGVATTEVVRTLVDCASQVPAGELDDLVDRALARRAIRLDRLVAGVEDTRARGRPGHGVLRERLGHRGILAGPHPSVLESRMARLLHRYHLRVPRAEVDWGPQRRYRLDFAFVEIRLVVEVNGWASHFDPAQQRYDHQRRNRLNQEGWTVLEYNWWEVTFEADQVAAEIAATYRGLAG